MQRVPAGVRAATRNFVLIALAVCCGSSAAEPFVPPPEAERAAVAVLAETNSRLIIDADFRVETIHLSPSCTNEHLKELVHFERLKNLQISSARIDDEGVNQIVALPQLATLTISNSRISQNGMQAIRLGLPKCNVFASRTAPPVAGFAPNGFGGARPAARPPSAIPTSSTGPRIARLVRDEAVRKELNLTPAQIEKLDQASSAAAMQALMASFDQKLLAELTPEQQQRVQQLELQQDGPRALQRPEVAKQLNLTEEQQKHLREATAAMEETSRATMSELVLEAQNAGTQQDLGEKVREHRKALKRSQDELVRAKLNDEQQKLWQEMVGAPAPDSIMPSSGFSVPFQSQRR